MPSWKEPSHTPGVIAEHDMIQYLDTSLANLGQTYLLYPIPKILPAHSPLNWGSRERESLKRPHRHHISTLQQQLRYWWLINTVLVTSLKYSIIPTTTKKINSIPNKPSKFSLLNCITTLVIPNSGNALTEKNQHTHYCSLGEKSLYSSASSEKELRLAAFVLWSGESNHCKYGFLAVWPLSQKQDFVLAETTSSCCFHADSLPYLTVYFGGCFTLTLFISFSILTWLKKVAINFKWKQILLANNSNKTILWSIGKSLLKCLTN